MGLIISKTKEVDLAKVQILHACILRFFLSNLIEELKGLLRTGSIYEKPDEMIGIPMPAVANG